MPKEIERKWLINKLPKLNLKEGINITQGYLVSNGSSEVRVRKAGKKHNLTIKKGDGISRDEVDVPITSSKFKELWNLTSEGARLSKIRYVVKYDNVNLELDIYSEKLLKLHIVKAEFPSVEEAMKFNPPEWVGMELTGDKRYSNRSLAEKGMP